MRTMRTYSLPSVTEGDEEAAMLSDLEADLQEMVAPHRTDTARSRWEEEYSLQDSCEEPGVCHEVSVTPASTIQDANLMPRLVNLHPDPELGGGLIHYLQPGVTHFGADPATGKLMLTGLDPSVIVCSITNEENNKLFVQQVISGSVSVDGKAVPEDLPLELHSGDRVFLNTSHIFRVVIPQASQRSPSLTSLMVSKEGTLSEALRVLQDCADVDPQWQRQVIAAALATKRDFGLEAAKALLKESSEASKAITEANEIRDKLVAIAPDHALAVGHHELAVMMQANGPPRLCILISNGAGQGSADQEDGEETTEGRDWSTKPVDIWEAQRFKAERLPSLRQALQRSRELQALKVLGQIMLNTPEKAGSLADSHREELHQANTASPEMWSPPESFSDAGQKVGSSSQSALSQQVTPRAISEADAASITDGDLRPFTLDWFRACVSRNFETAVTELVCGFTRPRSASPSSRSESKLADKD